MRVRIDLPIFYSETEAFGSVSGELDVDTLPQEGEVFPWPQLWVKNGPAYLAEANQSRIWGVNDWELSDAEILVTMFGFVCESVSDARNCAAFFQQMGAFEVVEY
ncbi:MAG: hypothetical protein ABW088_15375 [Sedimenticola sp.]